MVKRSDLLALPFYKKEIFKGSIENRMRYHIRLVKEEETEESHLLVTIYPGPNCYEKTPDELKQKATFPFSEEGMQQIAEYLNTQFTEQQALWNA